MRQGHRSLNLLFGFIHLFIRMTHPPGASLMAQQAKNPPAVLETRIRSRGQEDPRRRKWQATAVFWPGEFHGQRSLVGCSTWESQRVRYNLTTQQQQRHKLSERGSAALEEQASHLCLLTKWGHIYKKCFECSCAWPFSLGLCMNLE